MTLQFTTPIRPEFRARLVASRQQASSEMHSFSQAWAEGSLSRRQMGFWAMQHWYYIDRIPQQFGIMYTRCPDVDTRLFILENLNGEESPGGRHPDLLLDFAEACGYPRAEVQSADRDGRILPATRGIRAWIEELVQSRHLAEQAAGIMVALEGQLPTMYQKYVEYCRTLGFSERDLRFFTVHIEGDSEHADVGYRLCERYAVTPELEELAIGACRASAQMRVQYLDAVSRALRELA
ncbi:MAG: iron-containing redox enzyme family protein [Vicinamibacteria bacterium]